MRESAGPKEGFSHSCAPPPPWDSVSMQPKDRDVGGGGVTSFWHRVIGIHLGDGLTGQAKQTEQRCELILVTGQMSEVRGRTDKKRRGNERGTFHRCATGWRQHAYLGAVQEERDKKAGCFCLKSPWGKMSKSFVQTTPPSHLSVSS